MGENTVPKSAEWMEGVSLDRKLLSPPDYALYPIVPRLIDEIEFEPTIWRLDTDLLYPTLLLPRIEQLNFFSGTAFFKS